MDNLNNKLNSNNPIAITQIISKLVEAIINKKTEIKEDLLEFKFLYEKCLDSDPAVSGVASQGILKLVKNDILPVETAISHIMAIITTTKTIPHVTFVINNLMIIEMQDQLMKNNNYQCPYNLRFPQHPFVIILKGNANYWRDVYNEINYAYQQENLSIFCSELYKSVYLYILCNPNENHMNLLQKKLWSLLFQMYKPIETTNIINSLMCWMPFHSRDSIQLSCDFIIDLVRVNLKNECICNNDLLLLWQTSLLYYLILYKLDSREIISNIKEIIEESNNLVVLPCVLLILARAIVICPPIYLKELLHLCNLILHQQKYNLFILLSIKASVLQWIANSSILVSDANLIANEIYKFINKNQTKNNSTNWKEILEYLNKFGKYLNTNNEVFISIKLCYLCQCWENTEQILQWLQTLKDVPDFFIFKIIHFLYGLLLLEDNSEINLIALELILNCSMKYKNMLSNLLTLILLKLSNSVDYHLHFKLLKVLPKLAIRKENFQKITITIQALNQGFNVLKTFSASLMFDVWKIDENCYTLLENMLVIPYDNVCSKLEFYSTRAYILKEICASKPEVYGNEMVAHLSKILNECNDADGSLPCALALEGITSLCKFEIIDTITTWNNLEPLFKNTQRVAVIKSLCLFISEIRTLSYTDAYPKFLQEILKKLWEYIINANNPEIAKAALNALTAFSSEQIFDQFPEIYLSDLEVLGKNWINLLENCNDKIVPIVGDFMIQMISLEISNYLRHIYQVKGTREPTNYSYLPGNSMVRAIGYYIKDELKKWKNNSKQIRYLECLRVFSAEYCKPLPPLDWCFLQELFHESEAKYYCISIASHQVILSGTARRFMENYVVAITQSNNKNDIIIVYKNLRYLANSIQPTLLKPFFEHSINVALNFYESDDKEILLDIFKYLKETLKNSHIQDTNKASIAQVLKDLMIQIDESSELFDILIDCVILFPEKYLNDLCCPKSVKEVTEKWYKLALKIKCNLAINTNNSPMSYLNDLIEIGHSVISIKLYIFNELGKVFKRHKDNTENALWLLDMMGQMQATMIDKYDDKQITFHCDIFIFAVTIFSGYFVLDKDIHRLFPQALATLLDVNHWSICTTEILEWLYYMNLNNSILKEYRNLFGQCLQALRYEDEFKRNMKWIKYLSCSSE